MSSWRKAGLSLAALAVLAVDRDGWISDTVAAGVPHVDCGWIAPSLETHCGTVTDRDQGTRPLALGSEERFAAEVLSCSLAQPLEDAGRHVKAELSVRCEQGAPRHGEVARTEVAFHASVARVCDSSARAAASWAGTVELPAGTFLVSVDTRASEGLGSTAPDATDRCVARLGDEPLDRIRAGENNIFMRHIQGPARLPLEVDCDLQPERIGLVSAGCVGLTTDASPPLRQADLVVSIGVAALP